MLGFIVSKVWVYAVVILAVGGAAYYIKHLIESNAVLERVVQEREVALDTMANEFSNYALNSEATIYDYNVNSKLLKVDYEKSRKIIAISVERTNKHDYQKLLNARPNAFIRRANVATARLFRDFEKVSGYTKDKPDRDTTKASDAGPGNTATD